MSIRHEDPDRSAACRCLVLARRSMSSGSTAYQMRAGTGKLEILNSLALCLWDSFMYDLNGIVLYRRRVPKEGMESSAQEGGAGFGLKVSRILLTG